MRPLLLAQHWYSKLTPLESMREEALAKLRAEWSVEDGVGYFERRGIPSDNPNCFRVLGRRPPMSVSEVLAVDCNETVPVYTVQPNRYALPDGRDLFLVGRCRELATVYVSNIDPPIDYNRMGPDLDWIFSLWWRIGRIVPAIVEQALRGLSGAPDA